MTKQKRQRYVPPPPKKDDTEMMLRAILRNQRYMMLAISNLVREQHTLGIYHADKLSNRVRQMEEHWEWIALPSERIG
jgi:hypothetical protein